MMMNKAWQITITRVLHVMMTTHCNQMKVHNGELHPTNLSSCLCILHNHSNHYYVQFAGDYETSYNRKKKAFDVSNITKSSQAQCGCDRNCNDYLSFDMILRWRKKYHSLPMGHNQKAKLVELLKETLFQDGKGRTLHLVEQHLVCRWDIYYIFDIYDLSNVHLLQNGILTAVYNFNCRRAWYHNLLGISLSSYTRARRQVKKGTETIHTKKDLLGTRGQIALGYMKFYVSLIGDHSPERARILMPIGLTVNDVYRRYKMQYEDGVSPSHFYALWKIHMKHVSRQRVLSHYFCEDFTDPSNCYD